MIEGLLFDEARAFISNLDSAELENWFAWKDEWPDWKPVQEIPGMTEMIYRVMPVSPPPPPKGTEAESSDADILPITRTLPGAWSEAEFRQLDDAPSLSVTKSEFIERNQKRYNKRLHITILGDGNQQFKTYSRDVSVGGMNLEDSLPMWVKGYFKVRIAKTNSKQVIELTCCLIENQEPNDRHRIAILPLQSVQDEQNLENWLAA